MRDAFEAVQSEFQPLWHERFESGRTASMEDIDTYHRELNRELLHRLGFKRDSQLLVTSIERAFREVRPKLMPDVSVVLHQLHASGFELAVVSNGYRQVEDAVYLGIDQYFSAIVGSAHVGFLKPQPDIFNLALNALHVSPSAAVHVGDNYELDVVGARQAGVHPVLLDRDGNAKHDDVQTITSLDELLPLLA